MDADMYSTVTTNVAGVLAIIVMWSALSSLLTYIVMSNKHEKTVKDLLWTIEALDAYIDAEEQ